MFRTFRPLGHLRAGLSLVLAAALVAAPATAASASAQMTDQADLVDTAVAAGQFTTLATALEAAGLVQTLKTGGPFTVFAPTDAAFAKIPAAQLTALLADQAALTKVLTYHVARGAVPASEVVGLTSVTPIEGEPITVAVANGQVTLNGTSTVVATDIMASNGIIHVIDTVLLPPSMMAPPATPAPTAAPAQPAGGSTTARDGQTLATQSASTQALFTSVWGDRAAAQWVTEHNAALSASGR